MVTKSYYVRKPVEIVMPGNRLHGESGMILASGHLGGWWVHLASYPDVTHLFFEHELSVPRDVELWSDAITRDIQIRDRREQLSSKRSHNE